ncbi:MAG: glycyl radical protein [Chloroflexi bacterium]|nr:glycyl radical protein [Anaerolineaceae bacterium]NMB87849.1 glycyl radical protein [Chloroflexota bacterium]
MEKTFTMNATEKVHAAVFPAEIQNLPLPNRRIASIKEKILNTVQEIDVERARIVTRSYQRTENEPMVVRRAYMLSDLAQQLSIKIDEDELIVGNRSISARMGVISPEGAVAWVDRELEGFPTRPQDKFQIKAEDIHELRQEIFPYWHGKTLEDLVAQRVPRRIQHVVDYKAFSLNQTDHAQGHILPDVQAWVNLGIHGLRRKVQQAAAANPGAAQQDFYRAALITLEAASTFISRYAVLAEEMAAQERDAARREELLRIAENCRHLASHPAATYWQALQAVWFLFVLLEIESNASSISPGRLDQYIYPYLERDLHDGSLAIELAQELLENFWMKYNEIVLLRSSESARYFAGFPIGFNTVVGGQTPDGRDATNLLSYMCLRAQADLGMPQPNFAVRVYQNSPAEFLEAVAYVISLGSGMPQVFNDEVAIPGQIHRGIDPRHALDYAIVGCVELSSPGRALGWSDASMFNLVRILELTLFGGRDPQSGELVGLPTRRLDEMASMADLEADYDRQLQYFVGLMVEGIDIVDKLHAEVYPSPFLSLVVDDCIQKGQDVTAGGARYNFTGVQGVQVANVADSLLAIQTAVFDEHWLKPAELLDVLHDNYAGAEVLRQRLINRIPKYGNDEDQVDRFAKKWADRYSELVAQYPTPRGGCYQPGFYTVSAHVPMGSHVGATPDGRLSGAPLADGGVSPTAGRDRRGATAVLHSVSKINLELATNGTLLNMKFLPSFFEGKHAYKKFAAFLRGFSALKIPHVQFNVVSADLLREAQTNPDQFRHLVVRVAGYSAYFVELDTDLQNEIIQRTEFASV